MTLEILLNELWGYDVSPIILTSKENHQLKRDPFLQVYLPIVNVRKKSDSDFQK